MNKEFSDEKQRAAVCYNKWRKAKGTIEIDLFEGVCPECKCMPCVCGSHSLESADHGKHYPGKSVKRRKDGVPQKKRKKRATKKGEYRDKSGNLKKK